MSKVCGVLPTDVNRALNELAKEYKDSGMSNEDARRQAVNDILQVLENENKNNNFYTGSKLVDYPIDTVSKINQQTYKILNKLLSKTISSNFDFDVVLSADLALHTIFYDHGIFDKKEQEKNYITDLPKYIHLDKDNTTLGMYVSDRNTIVLPDYFKLKKVIFDDNYLGRKYIKDYMGWSEQDFLDVLNPMISKDIKDNKLRWIKLHEQIHAATVKFIDDYPSDKRVKELESIYSALLKIANNNPKSLLNKSTYWKKNIKEFIAEALSNPELINALLSTKLDDVGFFAKKGNSVFHKIYTQILNIIGLDTNKSFDNFYVYALNTFTEIAAQSDYNKKYNTFIDTWENQEFNINGDTYTLSGFNFDIEDASKIKRIVFLNTQSTGIFDSDAYLELNLNELNLIKNSKFVSAINILTEQDATLGSQRKDTQTQTTQLWEEKLLKQGLQETFERIGSEDKYNPKIDSDSHKKHLQSVISDMINPLLSTLDGYSITAEQANTSTTETQGLADLTNQNIRIITGISPRLNSLYMSAQEVMTHELVHAITSTVIDTSKGPVAALKGATQLNSGVRRLFNLAKAKITWQDLIPKDAQGNPIIPQGGTLADTEAAAKERWDYIFNDEAGILEFVAFGNTNEQFMNELKKIKIKKEISGDGTLTGAIKVWFQRAVDWLASKVFHVDNSNVASALHKLTLEIAGIKKKHNYALNALGFVGETTRLAVTKPVQIMFKGLQKGVDVLPEGSVKTTLNNLKYIPGGTRTKQFGKAIAFVADRLFKQREYFIFNLLSKLPSELIGVNPNNARFWALLRHSKGVIDVARHKMKDASYKNFTEMFSQPLTEEEDKSLYNLIAIDSDDLAKEYSYDQLMELLRDKSKRKVEIAAINKKLMQAEGKLAEGLIRQAHGLGKYMVMGTTFNQDQMLNTSNIVDLNFDPNVNTLKDRDAAYKEVQKLKSLYAMEYIHEDKLKTLLSVMDREFKANKEENGIINFIGMITVHKVQSLEKNFDGKEKLKQAGYTAEIYNPNVQIKFSTDPEDTALIAAGYVKHSRALKKGKGTKHRTQYMYVSNHNGLVAYNKAIISLTSEQNFGTSLDDIYRNQGAHGKDAYDLAKEDTKNILANMGDPYTNKYDINDEINLIPITDEHGHIVGFRYAMSELNREEILQKNYKASTVISTMYEQMTDKYNTKDINKALIADLLADEKENGVRLAKDFITITEKHPKYGELYKRIPETMKADLDKAFGKGKMIIREPLVDLVFGFPQYSLSREGLDNIVGKTAMMLMYGINAMRKKDPKYNSLSPDEKKNWKKVQALKLLRQVEQGWQEGVAEIKNVIVLKTMVLPFNIASNLLFSFMYGMPIDFIFKKQAEAVIALQEYNENLRRKMILENRMQMPGLSAQKKRELEGEINQLEADLRVSIVKDLVDKGVLNSIVEDIQLDIENDAYSMRNQLASWAEDKTKKIPEGIKETYKWAYITKDTKAYKLLETATRYSDFVARYAMYEWFTKEKKLPEQEAMATVMAAFVEYDPPTSRELQYLNDMGLFMFTKYAIRIQKAVARLFLDKPDTTIGLLMLEQMMGGNYPTPFDAFGIPTWNYALKDLTVMTLPGVQVAQDYSNLVLPGNPVDVF